MRHTEKALREALDEIALRFVSGNKIQIDSARISRSEWLLLQAALSLPETQGEPVGENLEPLPPEVHEAINAYAAYYAEHHKLGMSIRNDMQYIASVALRFALPSQPARDLLWSSEGYNGAIRVAADACAYLAENERPIEGEQRYNSVHLHQISEELELTIAMLAAAPAAPTQEGWQPIATAPKDNGPMLIAGGHYCFDSGIGTAKTVNNEVALAYWDRFLNRFDEGYGDESKFWYEPTHWMPLPPPPNRPDPSSPQPDKPPTA